jgi:hypothetical protein
MGGHKRSGVRADWSDDDYCTYYISRLSRNGLGWNRKNAKQGMSALLLKRIRFLAGSVCFWGVGQ